MTGAQQPEPNFVKKYFQDFKVLKETRREYWGLQVVNTLDSLAYFAMFNIAVLTLSDDFGFSDEHAGYIFAGFASATTLMLFVSGLITDWLGIKKSIYIALTGLGLMRVTVLGAAYMPEGTARNVMVIGGLALMAPFMAMLQTVFQAANKRFTTKKSRGAGFNLWYLFMNVGAAGGGFLVDIFYLELGLPRFHIFTFGIGTSIIGMIVTFFIIKRTDQLYGPDEVPEEEDLDAPKKNPWQIVKAVLGESVFWRFTLLISLLLGVRAVFLYLGLLHPKFWTRVIGPDAPIGTLQAFNPVLVIIGLIVLIPLLHRFNVYKMLVYGALITSISMFIIAIPPPTPSSPEYVADFTLWTTIGFLLLLTVGELIWSPRLQEYTAAIAPKGQEGTYLGLSMVPYFLAKLIVSALSGKMLARWCPEPPKDNPLLLQQQIAAGDVAFVDSPYMMWAVLGAVALAGTIVAILMKDYFTKGADFETGTKH